METIAKLFQNGRSQAVLLPKAFRFEGTEVRINKEGDKVILEPLKKQPGLTIFGRYLNQIQILRFQNLY